MLCQKCQKKEATTYYQETVNGKTTTLHLCEDCAKELGIGMGGFSGFNMNDIFSGFLTNAFGTPTIGTRKTCSKCHSTWDDIVRLGRMGCDECYHTFEKELLPTLENIHGKTKHVGKVSNAAGVEYKKKVELDQLKAQMQKAVEQEEFEKAAELRDQIKQLEQELEQ